MVAKLEKQECQMLVSVVLLDSQIHVETLLCSNVCSDQSSVSWRLGQDVRVKGQKSSLLHSCCCYCCRVAQLSSLLQEDDNILLLCATLMLQRQIDKVIAT